MKKILIVNDDRDFQNLITSFLIRKGYLADTINDDKAVVSKVEAEQPDLIILNMKMERDIRICKSLKESKRAVQIPILLLTGMTIPVRAADCSPAAQLIKPFRPEELILKIDELLN